jgi:pimeloyl-ACP methyl ester carboxylesterase
MSSILSQDFWVDTDQGKLFAKRWSPASIPYDRHAPIVLFHDSLGCVTLWRDFPERLAQATGRSVIAYDRLGFGNSDPHPGVLHSDFIGDEAHTSFRALRNALALEKFIAFGHSVGGGMAVGCAALHPEACLRLITESAQAFVEDRTIKGILEARRSFQQPGQMDRLTKYHGDKAAWVLSAWTDTWLSADIAHWTLDGDLGRVTCPALLLHGDQDEYGSTRHPERMAALTAGHSTLHILENCGHVPHREKVTLVLDIVTPWLADVTH